ncbi:MAG: cytochrome c [Armatimonadota bacterium]|nr:cytochrome c [bacterium]
MVAQRTWRWVGLIIGIIIVLIALGILFIYSGIYSVAANYPDSAPSAWVLSTTMERSVRYHAEGIKIPNLNNPKMVQAGFEHYQEDCVMCHGAPGVKVGEVSRGLNPAPPELTEVANDWKPNELFWITRNGIRMTGMPAWGVVDSDKEIWRTVAFMQKLPSMTPSEYKKLDHQAPQPEEP